MKEGDVFRWAYKPEHLPASGCYPYWCCAQLAIFDGSSLRDIYWTGYDRRTWSPEGAERLLALDYLGNLDDYEVRSGEDPTHLYAHADLLDLRHPNGGVCYVRKGAVPSLEVQVRRHEAEARRHESMAEYHRNWIAQLQDVPLPAEEGDE